MKCLPGSWQVAQEIVPDGESAAVEEERPPERAGGGVVGDGVRRVGRRRAGERRLGEQVPLVAVEEAVDELLRRRRRRGLAVEGGEGRVHVALELLGRRVREDVGEAHRSPVHEQEERQRRARIAERRAEPEARVRRHGGRAQIERLLPGPRVLGARGGVVAIADHGVEPAHGVAGPAGGELRGVRPVPAAGAAPEAAAHLDDEERGAPGVGRVVLVEVDLAGDRRPPWRPRTRDPGGPCSARSRTGRPGRPRRPRPASRTRRRRPRARRRARARRGRGREIARPRGALRSAGSRASTRPRRRRRPCARRRSGSG